MDSSGLARTGPLIGAYARFATTARGLLRFSPYQYPCHRNGDISLLVASERGVGGVRQRTSHCAEMAASEDAFRAAADIALQAFVKRDDAGLDDSKRAGLRRTQPTRRYGVGRRGHSDAL